MICLAPQADVAARSEFEVSHQPRLRYVMAERCWLSVGIVMRPAGTRFSIKVLGGCASPLPDCSRKPPDVEMESETGGDDWRYLVAVAPAGTGKPSVRNPPVCRLTSREHRPPTVNADAQSSWKGRLKFHCRSDADDAGTVKRDADVWWRRKERRGGGAEADAARHVSPHPSI